MEVAVELEEDLIFAEEVNIAEEVDMLDMMEDIDIHTIHTIIQSIHIRTIYIMDVNGLEISTAVLSTVDGNALTRSNRQATTE